jgi:uncharacterized protein (DUF1778 family)|nr:MAG TPA: hypothetical protein [Caudoviricetes sp.]DAN88644.1 MAG TPA: hypothetical protein [Caudoviricetes sp.]DAY70639.1 MAG TPA: hypothetical protein [Caudoviricetes sp.]
MATEAQIKANVKYNRSKDNIMIRPDKDEGKQIRQAAADAGKSVQAYILQAVREYMDK